MHKRFLILILCVVVLFVPSMIKAETQVEYGLNPIEDYQVLITYSTENDQVSENILKLEYLIQHFTQEVNVKPVNHVVKNDVNQAKFIFYFGEKAADIDKEVRDTINDSKQEKILIGKNIEQFGDYDYEEMHINRLETPNEKLVDYTQEQKINIIDQKYVEEAYLKGYERNDIYPILSKIGASTYYYGIQRMSKLNMFTFAEMLHEIMDNHHQAKHPAFIEIKDINPLTDAIKLEQITDKLIDKKIFFTLNISPVFKDNHENYTLLRENKALIKLLKDLQKSYGTIVASEYITYPNSNLRTSYWDLTADQAVWHENYDEVKAQFKTESEFPNETAYEAYLKTYDEEERAYLNAQVNKMIDVLTRHDLTPLAIDVPYSALSRNGYSAIAERFNYFIGKVQWDNQAIESVQSVPFSANLSFANGLTVLPNADNDQSLYTAERNFSLLLTVRDSFIIKGYSMYEPESQLDKVIEQYDKIPDIFWFNLKNMAQTIQSDQTRIEIGQDNQMTMDRDISLWQDLLRDNHYTKFEIGLWLLSIVIILFISVFLIISFSLRLRIKRRLFEERVEK